MGVEIERKYIVAIPDVGVLATMEDFSKSEILQIYLPSDQGQTHRIRRRISGNTTVCTETVKQRIDFISATECEHRITEQRFSELAACAAPDSHPISKCRYTFRYSGRLFELDVYPEWTRTAIMEIELPTRETEVELPPFITVLREVTGIHKYSNSSMSRAFPQEEPQD